MRTRRSFDFLRVLAIFVFLAMLAYLWIFIFTPKLIPRELRVLIPGKRVYILAMGLDRSYDEYHRPIKKRRSDSLVFAKIDPFSQKIDLVSIPRDTYVEVPGHGYRKINDAYYLGGKDLALETVSRLFGVKIDNYVVLNPDGLAGLIDSMGGLKVWVDRNMYYKDSWGGLEINLKKGLHILNGREVEGYIRFRHEAMGDIARVDRQQKFLRVLFRKLASPTVIVRLPWVLPALKRAVNTNMSLNDIAELGNFARMINHSEIGSYRMPGYFGVEEELRSYWMVNEKEKDRLFEKIGIK